MTRDQIKVGTVFRTWTGNVWRIKSVLHERTVLVERIVEGRDEDTYVWPISCLLLDGEVDRDYEARQDIARLERRLAEGGAA